MPQEAAPACAARLQHVQLYELREVPITVTLDTSAVLAVLLNESSKPQLVEATEGVLVVGAPSLPWEVGNALIAGLRKRRLTAQAVEVAWQSYTRVPVRLAQIDIASALKLAAAAGVYAYDAYVLETARQEGAPLLTLDAALLRVARAMNLPVLELHQ